MENDMETAVYRYIYIYIRMYIYIGLYKDHSGFCLNSVEGYTENYKGV